MLARSPLVVAGTNAIAATNVVGSTKGPAHVCQGGETVPQGTRAVRMWILSNVKPHVRVAVLDGARTVASGSLGAGWLGKVTTVPITPVASALHDATVCFWLGRGVQAVNLLGGPSGDPAPGEEPNKMRIEYLGPGFGSWWSRAGSVARRLGIGRAPEGGWAVVLPLAMMGLATALVLAAILRGPGRIAPAPPTAAWTCAAVALLSAATWSILTPPFQAPDEPSHFAYTQILAETGGLPELNTSVYSAEETTALNDLDARTVRYNPAIETISSPGQQQRLRHDQGRALSRVGRGAGVATSEPPLYYALQTLPYLLGSGGTLLERLELMRLLSALLAGVSGLFGFLFLREALPRAPWAWTVGGLGMALAPLVGFMSGVVNPDAMLCATAAALFYCLARAFRHELTLRLAIAIGAIASCGLLTKLNFLGLLPGVLLALALLARRAAPHSGNRAAVRLFAVAAGATLLPGCIYVLALLVTNDRAALNAFSNGISGTKSHPGSPLDELAYIWQFYLPRLPGMANYFPGISTTRQVWFDKSVGLYGWLDTTFPRWVYDGALIPAGAIAALCARELMRLGAAVRTRAAELGSYAAMALGLLGLFGADSYTESAVYTGTFSEPRYLLPLAVLFAAVLALAARGAGRRWGPAVGALIVLLILAHDIFSQLLVVSRYYG